METKTKYIKIEDLEVYQLARKLSQISWKVYQKMSWQIKKIVGDQFIKATDSVGANVTEGYHRYHFLDKIKFFYIARSSLSESNDHWIEIIKERKLIEEEDYQDFKTTVKKLSLKLNNFISSTYRAKQLVSTNFNKFQ